MGTQCPWWGGGRAVIIQEAAWRVKKVGGGRPSNSELSRNRRKWARMEGFKAEKEDQGEVEGGPEYVGPHGSIFRTLNFIGGFEQRRNKTRLPFEHVCSDFRAEDRLNEATMMEP